MRTSWHVEQYDDDTQQWRTVENSGPRLSRAHRVWCAILNDGGRPRMLLNGKPFTMFTTDEQLDLMNEED